MSSGKGQSFNFEAAPELPGADRLSKYAFGGIRQLTHRLWKFTIEGSDNVPLKGPAIIAPNHLSFCDSVFVPAALPRRVWAIGKGEYMDNWKTKHLFPAMGMIPVDRSGGDAAQAALDTAARVLNGGRLFLIYPEGTRSRSEFLHKGRTGAARLAIRCNAPVVPVGHEGTLVVQPPDSFKMKPLLPVSVRFGAPMWAHEYGDPEDPRTLRAFTDAVMFEIAQLSGQRYVDRYANKDDRPGVLADPKKTAPPTAQDDTTERINPQRPSIVGKGQVSIPRPTPRRVASPNTDGPATPAKPGSTAEPISLPPGRRAAVS